MKTLGFAGVMALVFTTAAAAQTATFEALDHKLNPAGGDVTLTASASYNGVPSAIGWSIVVPDNWTLVSISGPQVPSIASKAGSGGTLEFAYTAVPPSGAEFKLVVRYPARSTAGRATATALVRQEGKLKTLTPVPLSFLPR